METPPAAPPRRYVNLKLFVLVMLASTIGSFAIVPYLISFMGQTPELQNVPLSPEALIALVIVVQLIQDTLFSGAGAAIGVWLGPRVGLGAPDLYGWLAGEADGARRLLTGALPGIGIGLILGVVVVGLSLLSAPLMPDVDITPPPPWQGFLASISAGIREELWLRFGLMTLLAGAGALIAGRRPAPAAVIWVANVLAALAFGALHLPNASSLGIYTPAVVAFALVGNGLVGLACGWLYWRYGLVSAMLAHFSTDIVLHVIVPALAL